MATAYRFRGCKPGRTPQETPSSEQVLLVGRERRLHRLLHRTILR
jgi:hypothetical protein